MPKGTGWETLYVVQNPTCCPTPQPLPWRPASSCAWTTTVGPQSSLCFCLVPNPALYTHTVHSPHTPRGSPSKSKSNHVSPLLRTIHSSHLTQSRSQRSYEALQNSYPHHLPDFISLMLPLTHSFLDTVTSLVLSH